MFKVGKAHKRQRKYQWKQQGMKFTEEEFEYIYNEYIIATNCDLCDKSFKSNLDRQLDHCHKTGEIRNIVCRICNQKKADRKINNNNTSGYKLISKQKSSRYKQGFYWEFRVRIDDKNKKIKCSIDLEKLVIFRDKWLKENNYNT
jgi:hypothetical protein